MTEETISHIPGTPYRFTQKKLKSLLGITDKQLIKSIGDGHEYWGDIKVIMRRHDDEYNVYTFGLDEFKCKLGISDDPRDFLLESGAEEAITRFGKIELVFEMPLRIVRAHLRVCLTVRKKMNTKGNEPLIRFMNQWFTTERERP